MHDIAWAAGFYEGEGCITVQHSHNRRRRYAQMSVTQKDITPLEWFRDVVGAGTIYQDKPRCAVYRWRATKWADVERVILTLAPYLTDRRLVQAASVLAARTEPTKTWTRKEVVDHQ